MPITRLTLLTNPDKCNLHCPLCFLNQRGTKFGMGEMPFEIAETAIQKYAATLKEIIPSTMGEPLLYSHFDDLLELCETLKIPLNITTNGTFPGISVSHLLRVSSDIKISCMGFSEETFREMMPGVSFYSWKLNVLAAVAMRDELRKKNEHSATLSLQVTLHKKNVDEAAAILDFAEQIGIDRIKWNPAVFLGDVAKQFREQYELSMAELAALREKLKSARLYSSGSLFFKNAPSTQKNSIEKKCRRFENELWILPDGSVEHCPNPERRFGNAQNVAALCSDCPMYGP